MTDNMEKRSYTKKYEGLSDSLRCEVQLRTRNVFGPLGELSGPLNAIWDTGANRTSVSSSVARKLKWKKLSVKYLFTANGKTVVDTYYVDLILPNGIVVENLEILGVNLDPSTDVLIGMDVIQKGDLAITNKDKKTVYSFVTPSQKEIVF